MESYTIPEAAEAAGLSPRAVRTRVEEGELRASVRDGVRVISRAELERSGLLTRTADLDGFAHEEVRLEEVRLLRPRSGDAAAVFGELIERLDAHESELDVLKALVSEAETLWREERARSGAELAEARAGAHAARERVAQLEAEHERHRPRSSREALTPLFEQTEHRRSSRPSPA